MLYYYGCLKIIIHEILPQPTKDDIFSHRQLLKIRYDNEGFIALALTYSTAWLFNPIKDVFRIMSNI